MKLWDKYNQCMEIATRCGKVFGKLFKINVTNGISLWIDLIPLSENPMFNIHMGSDKNSDKLDFFINTNENAIKPVLSVDALNSIAYRLGYGIIKHYSIVDQGIIFYLDHDKTYSFYEDTYSFMTDSDTIESIQSDYPLLHHLQTDIELSSQLFFEHSRIKTMGTPVTRNGVKMFDYYSFAESKHTLEINVLKRASNIEVQIIDKDFGRNNLFNAMSLLSSLPFYGIDKPSNLDNVTKIYLQSIKNFSFEDGAQILSIDNQSLSKSDLESAVLQIENELGFREHRDWNKYIGV